MFHRLVRSYMNFRKVQNSVRDKKESVHNYEIEEECCTQEGQDAITVVLEKTSDIIGLSIIGAQGVNQNKMGIYIKAVIPGGSAYVNSEIQVGDQLIGVDRHSLIGVTQEQAADILSNTGTKLTLRVSKGAAFRHGLAAVLAQPSPPTIEKDFSRRSLKLRFKDDEISNPSIVDDKSLYGS